MRTETLTQRQSRSFLSCSCRKHGKRGKHACLRCNAPHTRETCLNTPRKQAATHLLHRCLFGSKCASAKPRTKTRNLHGETRMGAWTGCIFWLFKVLAAGSNKVDIEQVSLHSTLFLPSRLPPLLRAEHVRQRDNSKQSSSPKQMSHQNRAAEQQTKADELIKAEQLSARLLEAR